MSASLTRQEARFQALNDLPKLSESAAWMLVRSKLPDLWMQQSERRGTLHAEWLGPCSVPTPHDPEWPAVAFRVTRPASILDIERRGVVILTRLKPHSWAVRAFDGALRPAAQPARP